MEIVTVTDAHILEKAATIITDGGIVVYPTDTAYGVGVDALHSDALEKLYTLKQREESKPTHVVVADMAMAKRYVEVSPEAEKIAEAFLPGPLTLILPKRDRVPDELVAGKGTLGIRIPDYDFAVQLARAANTPITTPSANVAEGATPYSLDDVKSSFGSTVEQIDLLVDGGVLAQTLPSTLVDLSGAEPVILREGPISREQIFAVLK